MLNDRIVLSCKEILEKEFKIDARGYRLQEVDKFLDTVIHDYQEYNSIIKELALKNNKLLEENDNLKAEIRNLNANLEALRDVPSDYSNVDLIRRVSQLEKTVNKLEKIILSNENI